MKRSILFLLGIVIGGAVAYSFRVRAMENRIKDSEYVDNSILQDERAWGVGGTWRIKK